MRTGIGQTVCAKFPGRLPTVRWEVNVDVLIGAIEPCITSRNLMTASLPKCSPANPKT